MRLNHSRSVEPLALRADLTLDAADLELAFTSLMDPEEQKLFSDVYSPDWLTAPISSRLATLSLLTRRIEEALEAAQLNLTAGSPEPK